jgi:putative heme transporter
MKRWRWILAVLAVVTAGLAVQFAVRFPWAGTLTAVARADWLLLAAAAIANIVSLGAKAWAWHLVLLPRARHRFRTAQAATFVAAAVNSVSVSVSGEAARLHLAATRDAVPVNAGLWSLVWCRLIEALGLVVFLAVILAIIPTEPWMRPFEIGAWIVLGLLAAAWSLGVGPKLLSSMPASWRSRIAQWSTPPKRWLAPLGLSVVNWAAQWLTFHLAFVATHVSTTANVSLSALVMANLGGIFRITPGNVGVLQASLVLGMLAFHIAEDQALAAGLTLQAVQVVPILAIGVALVGAQGLRSLGAKRTEAAEAA